MQVIGFNLTSLNVKKEKTSGEFGINTKIEFKNIEKEEVNLLKEGEVLRIEFEYIISYDSEKDKKDKSLGEINFQGNIILSTKEEESKELLKEWKKKKIPQNFQIPLFNLIIRKCLPKAAFFADEFSLPSPFKLPTLQIKKEDQ
ncbi:MAG: hypothetical protein AABY05_00945 [Nanoarchaeota archaeon]